MDCYIGDDLESNKVWVIDQLDLGTRRFDEHKVMLAFPDRDTALQTFHASFSDDRGPDRVGTVREMTVPALKGTAAQCDA